MGDRANVVVRQQPHDVYLYTHWAGTELAVTVRNALARKQRWTDDSYLTRIIFDQMTAGQHGQETGFGIATSQCDNEHNYVVVDPSQQTVTIAAGDFQSSGPGKPIKVWTFAEYIALDDDALNAVYQS